MIRLRGQQQASPESCEATRHNLHAKKLFGPVHLHVERRSSLSLQEVVIYRWDW